MALRVPVTLIFNAARKKDKLILKDSDLFCVVDYDFKAISWPSER